MKESGISFTKDPIAFNKAFLGETLCAQFIELEPFLLLCFYNIFIADSFEGQAEGLYQYDGYMPFKQNFSLECKKMLLSLVRKPVFAYFKSQNHAKNNNAKTLISSTFYSNPRYSSTIDEIITKSETAHICLMHDMPFFTQIKPVQCLDYIKTDKKLNANPIFVGDTVEGESVKKCMHAWHSFAYNLLSLNKNCEMDFKTASMILTQLQRAISKRQNELYDILKNEKIKEYITINHYCMYDVMLITVLKKLDVHIKQFEHYPSQYDELESFVATPQYRIAFADEYFCWSESEVKFHKQQFSYLNVLTGKDVKISSAGNPETPWSVAKQYGKEISSKAVITLMLPYEIKNTEEELQKHYEWRKQIFEQLALLGQRQNVKVRVRYKPNGDYILREKEKAVLAKLGIEVTASTPQSLMQEMFESIAVFSTACSVLSTSKILGRVTYQIAQPNVHYAKVDDEIHYVNIDEVSNIVLPKNTKELKRADFLDCDKLLS